MYNRVFNFTYSDHFYQIKMKQITDLYQIN